ncbi:hypothetical protein PRK78_004052 [Emydomyces testavorans]|uniref:Uncharacterized protein n=1 Tax=Emydomyces testavorans TaxID=2070801 RepID=A0AAF0DH54_9EURO|nr:hypothetical protein PRK78_004052 [Emydomyces testavorans]
MFRRSRATEPDNFASILGRKLEPLPVLLWGANAMGYLGVPIVLGANMLVVRDEDYQVAIHKFKNVGFIPAVPDRNPPPEIMESHPNPGQMVEEINAGYKRLDRSCAVFNCPDDFPEAKLQVYLFPNSFAHLPRGETTIPPDRTDGLVITRQYDVYKNLYYPLEKALVESFVKAAIEEEDETCYSTWGELLRSWVSLMTGYLNVNNDVLDHCADEQVVEWYSLNFGRLRGAKMGPFDRRISKRLGSGREMPVDMRGDPI